MPIYQYLCKSCKSYHEIDKKVALCSKAEHCKTCKDTLERIYTVPHITGTRDSFGIGRKFTDETTGKEITSWKEWERAGYKDPMSGVLKDKRGSKENQVKEAIDRRKIKERKKVSVQMKGGTK